MTVTPQINDAELTGWAEVCIRFQRLNQLNDLNDMKEMVLLATMLVAFMAFWVLLIGSTGAQFIAAGVMGICVYVQNRLYPEKKK